MKQVLALLLLIGLAGSAFGADSYLATGVRYGASTLTGFGGTLEGGPILPTTTGTPLYGDADLALIFSGTFLASTPKPYLNLSTGVGRIPTSSGLFASALIGLGYLGSSTYTPAASVSIGYALGPVVLGASADAFLDNGVRVLPSIFFNFTGSAALTIIRIAGSGMQGWYNARIAGSGMQGYNATRATTSSLSDQVTISGDFKGLAYGNTFKLSNGQVYEQVEYYTWVYYAYNPKVTMFTKNGATYLLVAGVDRPVQVVLQ